VLSTLRPVRASTPPPARPETIALIVPVILGAGGYEGAIVIAPA
jgi:hypothetical protein